jgi:periplasmic protein TonB
MERRQRALKNLPVVGGLVLALVLVAGLVWMIHGFMAGNTQKTMRQVQNITVIRPPPPPPEETPPPPPPDKVDEPIPQNEPEPTPDNAPTPSQQLGLDAEGGAGNDGFGLAARKGGSDLVGSAGAAFAWYTGKLKDEVSDRLSNEPKLRGRKFKIGVRVWIEADGRIREYRLTTTSGSSEVDGAIQAGLASIGRLSESPPLEMPQPITLQIVSRS